MVEMVSVFLAYWFRKRCEVGSERIATWAAGPAGVDPHALASGWDSRCERNAKVKGFIEYSLMPLYRFRH